MIVDDFHDLFRYKFWHRFVMSFGFDFGTTLAYSSMFFRDRFVDDFWIGIFSILIENGSHKQMLGLSIFLMFLTLFCK